jgi:poly(3-hydroxybutyrate) depolymerase
MSRGAEQGRPGSPRAEMRHVQGALPYLLSVPAAPVGAARPLLCFLHGSDEGGPTPIRAALTRHGPLSSAAAARATSEFVVVAPQLPLRGDWWYRHAAAVASIIRQVQQQHAADARRTYLTGFSFGGNGVFDLALATPSRWTALWPVDPTRVPPADPGLPLWLSSGEVSRHNRRPLMHSLQLQPPGDDEPGERVYEDRGEDHVGTARVAYGDDRIYRWLLSFAGTEPAAG